MYDDIINLEHYEPRFHKRMDRYNRSAQFSSFAALKGYEEMVEEEARLTSKKKELTEEEKNILDNKLSLIMNNINEKPLIKILYFISDNKKSGGSYKEIVNNIKRINKNYIEFIDGSKVLIKSIIKIDGDIFKYIEF